MDILKSDRIEKYIKESGRGLETYKTDSHVFISKWSRYIEDKFDDDHNVVRTKSSIDLMYRSKYYNDAFYYKRPKISREYSLKDNNLQRSYYNAPSSNIGNIGSGGDDSVIIAYDSLLDAGNNWEKLVYYAMLHTGDADTTGCIAGGFFGALYGLKPVGNNFTDDIEQKSSIIELGKKLYNKFK
jgi:ADP-ribosylglycohydrolase